VVTCPSCGQENPGGFKFCGACGSPLASPESAAEEERKVVTALFTDIAGSTARAETLDPEDVRAMLAPYYARVRSELERFGGTVEKFIGDAVVALFGAPIAHENDPERAVRAAIAIGRAVSDLNAEHEWLDLHIRTAVNTGEALVVVGARAVEGEGMAAGDVMNTAARLQSAAPVDGVVVGEATFRATASMFDYEEAEPIAAKGKAEPVPAWILVGEKVQKRPERRRRLVGRQREVDRLLELWRQTLSERRPRQVIVTGSPGIGKSRLLVELAQLVGPDVAMYWGRCLPYGEGITYWPVIEIVKSAAGILSDDDPSIIARKVGVLLESLETGDRDELRTMASALANLLGVATTPEGTYSAQEMAQAELHWGIRRVLALLAGRTPLILVLEDLHWAEPTLLELLQSLLQGNIPLLVTGTTRPELSETEPEFMLERDNCHVLAVEPLGEDASEELLGELVGSRVADLPQLRLLLQKMGGNPLFLEETVGMLADADLLTAEGELESLPVPESLQALIGSRLDLLPSVDKRVAQQASVVGEVFWLGAVAHLAGSPDDLPDRLAALQRRDFVHPRGESRIAGDREYAFKHILIRDVAYERLPKGRRAELHVRFSEWLKELPAAEHEFVEVLAYHLEQACRFAQEVVRSPVEPPFAEAAFALSRAGEKAEGRGGIREADRYYVRALDLIDDRCSEAALDLRVRRAMTRYALGEVRQAADELAMAADDANVRGHVGVRGNALAMLGGVQLRLGKVAEAREKLSEAHEIASQTGDRALEIRAVYRLAALSGDFEGELEHAVATAQEGVQLAEEIDDHPLQTEGHLRLGFFLENLGRLSEAEGELKRCLELAEETGSLRDDARATYLLGLVRYYRGDAEEAERLGLQARDWLDRIGESYMGIQNLVALAKYALAKDDTELAKRWLQEALPLALEGGGFLVTQIYRHLVDVYARENRLDDARELLEFARRDMPEEDPYAATQVLLAEASLACGIGDAVAAARAYDDALRLLEEQQLVIELAETRLELARALHRFANAAGARVELDRARESFAAMGAIAHLAEIDGIVGDLEAEGAGMPGPLAAS
jgi:class 3 adenylate cyclase/tetratricopeptide (TPR) repeat protein